MRRIFQTLISFTCLSLLSAGAVAAPGEEGKVPDYSRTPRSQVPEEFTWKLTDLFPDRAAWEKERDAVKAAMGELEKRAEGWTSSPDKMLAFLDWLSVTEQRLGRVSAYASFLGDGDLASSEYKQMQGEVSMAAVDFEARLGFLNPDILALGSEKLAAYAAAEPKLAPYLVNFDRVLREKDHVLPAESERLVSLTGMFAGAPGRASSMLNDVDVPNPEVTLSTGEKATLNQAGYGRHRASAVPADRRMVMETYWKNMANYTNTFAILYDASVKRDFYDAQVHKYPDCLTAALFPSAIDTAVYRNLVQTVRENLAPLHRLLRLRKKMLGLAEMKYGDVYASAVQAVKRTYGYDEAVALVRKAMQPLGADYGAALAKALGERWVDVYPNLNKNSGAYSSGVYGVHPFVKMNYDGTYSNVSTLAHELGHAMHSWFSTKTQPYPTAQYPIFLAEVASTFNEALLMEELLRSEKDDALKLFLLDSFLERVRATLYRQVLFAEFELAAHERVQAGQTLTKDWLNAKYLELTRLYYGHDQGVMDVEDYIRCEWAGIPHFYRDFYVYQYSTGIVASMALADAVLSGREGARERYLAFLGAGGSKYPLEILRDAGVDMARPEAVKAAIQRFDSLVGEMEALAARLAPPAK